MAQTDRYRLDFSKWMKLHENQCWKGKGVNVFWPGTEDIVVFDNDSNFVEGTMYCHDDLEVCTDAIGRPWIRIRHSKYTFPFEFLTKILHDNEGNVVGEQTLTWEMAKNIWQ